MSSPVGYPQRNAYPMFSSTSQGDVPVGKNGADVTPVMANVTTSSGEVGNLPQVVVTGERAAQVSDELSRRAVQSAVPKSLDKIQTVLLYGDSGVQYANFFISLGPLNLINDGSGICTVNVAHNFCSGMSGNIVNSADPYWSAPFTITRVSGSKFTFPLDPRAAATLNSTPNGGLGTGLICMVINEQPSRAGIFHSLNARFGMPWICVGNRAANAKSARLMMLDVERDIGFLGYIPDAVWIQAGANDYRVENQQVDICAQRAQALIEWFIRRGIAVFYQPWQPNDSRDTLATTAGKAAIRYNNIMRPWCLARNHVYYMPRGEAMVDPTSILGYAKAGMMATDGIHDTPISGMSCAELAYQWYKNLIPRTLNVLPYSAADSQHDSASWHNRYQNPLFLSASGGSVANGTGTVPYKVAINKSSGAPTVTGVGGGSTYSVARTVANDGDAYGNNLGAQITFSAASEEQYFDIVGDVTGLGVGDKIRFGAHVKTKLVSGARPKTVCLSLLPTQDAVLYQAAVTAFGVQYSASNPTVELPYDTDEVLLTGWFTVTGSLTAIQGRVWIVSIGAGVVDVEIGRPMMEVVKAS